MCVAHWLADIHRPTIAEGVCVGPHQTKTNDCKVFVIGTLGGEGVGGWGVGALTYTVPNIEIIYIYIYIQFIVDERIVLVGWMGFYPAMESRSV